MRRTVWIWALLLASASSVAAEATICRDVCPLVRETGGAPEELADCMACLERDVVWVGQAIGAEETAEENLRTLQVDVSRLRKLLVSGEFADRQSDVRSILAEMADTLGLGPDAEALRAEIEETRSRIQELSAEPPPGELELVPMLAQARRALLDEVQTDLTKQLRSFESLRETVTSRPSPVGGWEFVVNSALQRVDPTTGRRVLADDSRTRYGIAAHEAYSELKGHAAGVVREKTGSAAARARLVRRQQDLSSELHALMDRLGLRRSITGLLVPALSFTSAGNGGDDSTKAAGYVRFESRHWPTHSSIPFDISLGGRVGVRSIMTAVNMAEENGDSEGDESSDETPAAPTSPVAAAGSLEPLFQNAITWDLGINLGTRIGSVGELSFFGRGGQSHVTDKAQLVEPDGRDPFVGIPADLDGRTKAVFDYGVRLAAFTDQHRFVHDHAVLQPLLELVYGHRQDRRFAGLGGFTNPERRGFIRFALNGLPVLKSAAEEPTFSLTFAVEHEWARDEGGFPSGTSITIEGNLDLLEAIGFGSGSGS